MTFEPLKFKVVIKPNFQFWTQIKVLLAKDADTVFYPVFENRLGRVDLIVVSVKEKLQKFEFYSEQKVGVSLVFLLSDNKKAGRKWLFQTCPCTTTALLTSFFGMGNFQWNLTTQSVQQTIIWLDTSSSIILQLCSRNCVKLNTGIK